MDRLEIGTLVLVLCPRGRTKPRELWGFGARARVAFIQSSIPEFQSTTYNVPSIINILALVSHSDARDKMKQR